MEKYTKNNLPILSFLGTCILFWYLGRYGVSEREIIAIIVTFSGYVFWFIGRIYLGSSYSLIPEARHLVTKGIYSKIQHPLYFSQSIVFAGVLLFINSFYLWLLFPPIILLQWYRSREESNILGKAFGGKYITYRKQTWF